MHQFFEGSINILGKKVFLKGQKHNFLRQSLR